MPRIPTLPAAQKGGNALKLTTFVAVATTTLVLSVAAVAAPNIYGTGGLIEVPDDTITAVGSFAPAFHSVIDVGDSSTSLNFWTVSTGIIPKLEVSGGFATDGDSEGFLNGKYRVLSETKTVPSVTVGVIDAFANLSDDATAYIEVGKNLTSTAEEVAGRASKPLRGYLGVGTGILDGLFLGLDWTLAPKFSAMFEYIGSDKGLEGDSHFNGGIRYAVTDKFRVDASLIDFKDLSLGVSYNALKF
jgi:hypothetical protein